MLLALTSRVSRPARLVLTPLLIAFSLVLTSCNLFEKTCEEDDRDCIGPGPGLGVGLGSECQISADCKEGLSCLSGVCQVTGRTPRNGKCRLTAECGDDDYCGSQRICLLAGNGIAGEECEDTGACIHGLVCEGPDLGDIMEQTGVVTLNELAELRGSCTVGGNGEQGDPCAHLSDCLAGLYCLEVEQAGQDKICTNIPMLDFELPPLPELWEGVTCEAAAEDDPKKAVFEIPRADVELGDDFYALPFPNDIRRSNGHIDMSGHPVPPPDLGVPFIERYTAVAGEDLAGFSTNAVAVFRFSHSYDFTSVRGDDPETVGTDESTIRLIDITPGSPEYNTSRGIEWKTTEGALSTYVCPHWLGIKRPQGNPLHPNRTYAAIVLNGVAPEDEGSFERDADFEALLGNSRPSDSVLRDAWDAYAPLREWLGDSDATVEAAEILTATVFTTHDPEAVIRGLRERVVADGVATVSSVIDCSAGETLADCESPDEEETDGIRGDCEAENAAYTELHARITLPMFQDGTLPYGEPEDGGGIRLDSQGKPIIDNYREVCMSISVPNTPPPAGGYPVLVFSHGTGGSFTNPMRGVTPLAAELANGSTPAVVVAIDMPMHGDRRGESDKDPDGLFYNFLNPRAARDNVMQGSADLMSVVQWINQDQGFSAADSPTNAAIPFNGTRIAMMGHSQGATHTAIMMSYEPLVSAVVLSGVGGHLTSSLLTKTNPVDIASVVPVGLQDPDDDFKLAGGDLNPALAIVQSVFDAVDPINYARHLHREPTTEAPTGQHVFVTYGLDDTFSTEQTQLAYALAARLDLVSPVRRVPSQIIRESVLPSGPAPFEGNKNVGGTARTIGMRQYATVTTMPGPEGVDVPLDGHFVGVSPGEPGRADVLRFLQQALAGQTPQIGE